MAEDLYLCPICNRKHRKIYMSWHHLLPTTDKEEKSEPRIYICLTCHTVIHYCHTNKELRTEYNTIDKILKSFRIIKMVEIYKYKSENCIFSLKKLKRKAA